MVRRTFFGWVGTLGLGFLLSVSSQGSDLGETKQLKCGPPPSVEEVLAQAESKLPPGGAIVRENGEVGSDFFPFHVSFSNGTFAIYNESNQLVRAGDMDQFDGALELLGAKTPLCKRTLLRLRREFAVDKSGERLVGRDGRFILIEVLRPEMRDNYCQVHEMVAVDKAYNRFFSSSDIEDVVGGQYLISPDFRLWSPNSPSWSHRYGCPINN